jgi:hypothetical protein
VAAPAGEQHHQVRPAHHRPVHHQRTHFTVVRHLHRRHVSPAHRSYLHPDDGGDLQQVPGTPALSAPGDVAWNFPGLTSTGWVPPDDNLAVGGGQVVEAVNEQLAFWNTAGSPINNSNGKNFIGLSSIFTGVSGSLGVFDPRIVFDPANGGHFLLTGLEFGSNPQVSNLDLAVSTTANPTPSASSWHVYRVSAGVSSGGTNYWLDFDGLGFDSTAIYVTGNLFSFATNPQTFLGARLMTFDKNALETSNAPGGGTPTLLSPTNSEVITDGGSLQPAVTLTPGTPEYLIEDWSTTQVRVHTVTNPLSLKAYDRTTALVTVPSYGLNPPNAPQQGATSKVAVNDTRIINAVYSNGYLYAAHTIQNTAGGQNKATARWYQINVSGTPTLTRSGNIDPGTGIATFFPAIAVDPAGNIGVSYAESSSSMYPSAYYTTIPASGGSGTTGAIEVGQAATSSGRWGDYSGIVADPAATGAFYAVGMAEQSSSQPTANWGTWWIHIQQGASQLAVSAPSPATAGTAFNVTVTAQDAGGNPVPSYTGTVHFTSTDAKAVLPADYTFTAGDAGSHTFTVTLETAGAQTVTATDTVSGSVTGSQSVTVNPAAAASFTVAGFPTSTTAGAAQSFTVTAHDAFGNVATGYTGTVHFTSSDAQAALPADTTFTAGDAGTHTFTATLKTVGTQSLTATDTATSSITGSETSITVNPASAASFTVAGFPTPTTAGTAQTFTVTAYDPYNNVATGYTGTVHFTSTDVQAGLPADYTFTAGDAGTHTFAAVLATAGTQSLTATDTATGSITGSETGITVNAAAVSGLTVAGYPATAAGIAQTFTVTAVDAYGNTVPGYAGTVHFTSTDPKAALPANYTFTAGDAGQHTFTATLKTAGAQSLTATDSAHGSIAGTETGIAVSSAAASRLITTGFPASTVAGTAQTFTVTAYDPYNNVATGYTGTVHFTASDGKAVLPADYPFGAGDAGTHTFTATFFTAGARSITATDTVNSALKSTQTGITVTAAAFAKWALGAYPGSWTAGAAQSFTLTAQDTYGNTVTTYAGTVHFTSTDAQASLPADTTFGVGDAGRHTFSATMIVAGSHSLTATDTASGIAITATRTTNPAAASTLKVTGYPSPTTAGAGHSFTVTAYDPYGNVATGYLGTVAFTSSDAAALLPANTAFAAADHGKHIFTATFKTTGTQSLTATDTGNGSINGTQSNVQVN